MNKLSKTSIERLSTCHSDIQKVITLAIELSPVDFGIAEGHRSEERQIELFNEGKSKVKKGKHNFYPSRAVDIYAFVNRKASWDNAHLTFLGGFIIACAKHLKEKGEITHDFRWGGNWDGDGEIISDQNFIDLPHFEII